MQVSTVANFASTVSNQPGLTGTSLGLTGLTLGATYYWQVNATNLAGTSPWSGVWNFGIALLPGIPALVAPTNGAAFTDYQPVTFSWSTVANATFYTVQIGTSTSFTSPFTQSQVNTYVQYTPPHGQVYWWEVSASSAAGTSAWSSVWSLTPSTAVAPPLSLSNTHIHTFSLKQGVIGYSLPQSEQVELSVYDILGRTAMTVNRHQAAGSYSIDLKGSSLAAGQYFVRFKAGAFEKQAVMMLVR